MEANTSRCFCRALLGVLVIVFAWLPGSWTSIALTVVGALLAILALVGTCCCATMREKAKSEAPTQTDQ
jgi:hypothetical protein